MAHVRPIVSALCAVALAACTGGASSTSSSSAAGPRTARGAITSRTAGAIVVNGIRISTAGAAVRVDDAPGGADDLLPGMVVTVKGRLGEREGEAAEIEFDDSVRGRVTSASGGIVEVGGIEVHVDPATLGSARVGDRVRVSGVPDDKGGLRASRLDDDPGVSEDLEVKGFVSALDAAARNFELRLTPGAAGFVLVDWSGITLPPGVSDGAFVEVRSAGPVAGTPPTLVAVAIEVEDRFGAGAEVELEGIVTADPVAVGGGLELSVDGVTVRTDGATRFENGQPADLVRGTKIEAEGSLDAGGVLHAEKVSFRDVVRITAPVDAVGAGALTVLGVEVLLSDFVDWGAGLGGSVSPGHVVEVRGIPTAGGGVLALRVDDRSGESRVTLQGVAAAKDATVPDRPAFVVMGIRVTTDASSELRALDGTLLGGASFHAAVEVGRTVLKVRTRSNPTAADVVVSPPDSRLLAKQIEIEGHDG